MNMNSSKGDPSRGELLSSEQYGEGGDTPIDLDEFLDEIGYKGDQNFGRVVESRKIYRLKAIDKTVRKT